MAYGTVKVDNITFDNGGSDQNVTVSGLYRATTSGVTVTGTISGAVLVGTTTVSGATVTGNVVQGTTVQGVSGTFTSLTGTTTTGTTANFASGVFTTRVSGTIITGDTGQFTSGTFVSLTGTTITGTTINGVTVAATTGSFTSLTGTTTSGTTANFVSGVFTTQVSGTTVTGTTSNFTSGNFATLSGATATFTSGVIALGTATNPSLSFVGDPNTGIYSPGADQLAVATNGTGRLFVDASGNVGVGTASPNASSKLHVADGDVLISKTSGYASLFFNFIGVGTARAASIKKNHDSPFDLRIQGGNNSSAAPICFDRADGFENARFDDSGRLGIGTTSPSATLELSGTGTVFKANTATTTSTAISLQLGGLVTSSNSGCFIKSHVNLGSTLYSQLSFEVNGGALEAARIDSSGRLLVGTSSARGVASSTNSLTQVETSTYLAFSAVNNTNDTGGSAIALGKSRGTAAGGTTIVQSGDDLGTIFFAGANGTNLESQAASIKATVDGTPGASDMPGRLVFSTTADGAASPTERMRIGNAGVINLNSGTVKFNPSGYTEISVLNDANANGFVFDTGDGGAGNRPKFKIRYGTADQILLDGTGNAEKPGGGSWAAISDSRAKENIVDYTSGLDQLKQIQPRSYRYIGNETTYIGLVAQEVEDAMPELVKLGEGKLPDGTEVTDFRTLDQTPLTFALINAVKEMAEQIDLLKAKVTALEGA